MPPVSATAAALRRNEIRHYRSYVKARVHFRGLVLILDITVHPAAAAAAAGVTAPDTRMNLRARLTGSDIGTNGRNLCALTWRPHPWRRSAPPWQLHRSRQNDEFAFVALRGRTVSSATCVLVQFCRFHLVPKRFHIYPCILPVRFWTHVPFLNRLLRARRRPHMDS